MEKFCFLNFRFWLFFQPLLQNVFDSMSVRLSRSKIRFFGRNSKSGLLIWFSLLINMFFCLTVDKCFRIVTFYWTLLFSGSSPPPPIIVNFDTMLTLPFIAKIKIATHIFFFAKKYSLGLSYIFLWNLSMEMFI